jgi:hypothetical protein
MPFRKGHKNDDGDAVAISRHEIGRGHVAGRKLGI